MKSRSTLLLFVALTSGMAADVSAGACTDVTKCEQECPCAESKPWKPALTKLLNEFKTCNPSSDDTTDTACNVFLARALAVIYKVKDFGSPGSHMNSAALLPITRLTESSLTRPHV